MRWISQVEKAAVQNLYEELAKVWTYTGPEDIFAAFVVKYWFETCQLL